MNSAVVFLLAMSGAAVLGSLVLWVAHRIARPEPNELHEQLRVLAPRHRHEQVDQPPGIVPLESEPHEEH